MDGISSTGLSGILDGHRRAANASERAISAFSSEQPEDAVSAFIDLQAARRQVEASTKVIKVGQDLLGATLDIFA